MKPEQMEAAKEAFLAAFEQTGIIYVAARAAGVHRSTVAYWLEHDEAFSLRYHVAEVEASERLEAEAYRRAVQGVERRTTVFYKGQAVGENIISEYDSTLLIFLMKARMPAKYRERFQPEEASRAGNLTAAPEWQELRAALLGALERYPEARSAVAEVLAR